VHLLIDSTGPKLYRADEWLLEKHGTKVRRSWRELHIGKDAETGQIADPIACFTGDGAYDWEGVSTSVAERHPETAVVVPPRSTAVPSETA
jgi:hypothetical protein